MSSAAQVKTTPNPAPISGTAGCAPLTIGFLPGGDRFEDFHDKIGVSLETFREQLAGGWLFNYIKALGRANIRTVLIYTSARVTGSERFTHVDTGAPVWVLPSPWLHQKARSGQRRYFPGSGTLAATASYLATPLRRVASVLRQEQCDAILCQEYEHTRFDVCVFLGRLLRLPVFATYQGGGATGAGLERLIRRQSIHRCAGLVIPSRSESSRVQGTSTASGATRSRRSAIRWTLYPLGHPTVTRSGASLE